MKKNRRYQLMEAALAAMIHKEGHASPNNPHFQVRLARLATHPEFTTVGATLREVIQVYAHLSHHSMEVRKVYRYPHFFQKPKAQKRPGV